MLQGLKWMGKSKVTLEAGSTDLSILWLLYVGRWLADSSATHLLHTLMLLSRLYLHKTHTWIAPLAWHTHSGLLDDRRSMSKCPRRSCHSGPHNLVWSSHRCSYVRLKNGFQTICIRGSMWTQLAPWMRQHYFGDLPNLCLNWAERFVLANIMSCLRNGNLKKTVQKF